MRNWLISIRKDVGVTQKWVAEQAGISQASYCNIEKGEMNPAVQTAKAIAGALGFEWTRFYE